MDLSRRTAAAYYSTLVIAGLAFVITILGIWIPEKLFPSESNSLITQSRGQDLLTLVVAIPLLVGSAVWAVKGKNRARSRVLWMGVLFYFVYTYLSALLLLTFNRIFLVHVALFGLSLYSFVFLVSETRPDEYEIGLTPGLKRGTQIGLITILLAMLALWGPEIIQGTITGEVPDRITNEGGRTHVFGALDYGLLLPFTVICLFLVARDEKLGYILTPILLVKVCTLGLAVLSMTIFLAFTDTPAATGEVIGFVIVTAILLLITTRFVLRINEPHSPDQEGSE